MKVDQFQFAPLPDESVLVKCTQDDATTAAYFLVARNERNTTLSRDISSRFLNIKSNVNLMTGGKARDLRKSNRSLSLSLSLACDSRFVENQMVNNEFYLFDEIINIDYALSGDECIYYQLQFSTGRLYSIIDFRPYATNGGTTTTGRISVVRPMFTFVLGVEEICKRRN